MNEEQRMTNGRTLMAAMSATERCVCIVSSCSRHHSSSSSVSSASRRCWSSTYN